VLDERMSSVCEFLMVKASAFSLLQYFDTGGWVTGMASCP